MGQPRRNLPFLNNLREIGLINFDTIAQAISSNADLTKRLALQRTLEGHTGCVNTLSFASNGATLISGSDDCLIKIWDSATGKELCSWDSGHTANVFQAKALTSTSAPTTIVSSGLDGQVRLSNISPSGATVVTKRLFAHEGAAHKLALIDEGGNTFLSCAEDGLVVLYDQREKMHIQSVVRCRHEYGGELELYSVNVNPLDSTQFCVGGRGNGIMIFDLRAMNSNTSSLGQRMAHYLCSISPSILRRAGQEFISVTCATYSKRAEILATYNDDNIYLFSAAAAQGLTTELDDTGKEIGGAMNSPTSQPPADQIPSPSDGARLPHSTEVNHKAVIRGNSVLKHCGFGNPIENPTSCIWSGPMLLLGYNQMQKRRGENTHGVLQVYKGHRNERTIKGVTFFGMEDEWVVSGSDCGHFYIYNTETGQLQASYRGDSDVVNCLERHPSQLLTLGSSGIDSDIKIWAPTAEEPRELTLEDYRRIDMNIARQSVSLMIPDFVYYDSADDDESDEETSECETDDGPLSEEVWGDVVRMVTGYIHEEDLYEDNSVGNESDWSDERGN